MIRIQNIYYMLAYAYQVLREDGYQQIAQETFEHACDLFAEILSRGMANQVRRGLVHDYRPARDNLSALRGKIELTANMRQLQNRGQKLECVFDEYSEDTEVNRILKSTALKMIRANEVRRESKQAIKRILLFFSNVQEIDLHFVRWGSLQYNRSNQTYRMLMEICYMIENGLLMKEQGSGIRLRKFLDDQRMSALYERFLRAYLHEKYPQYRVAASTVDWALDESEFLERLPVMRTDVTLRAPNKTLIIDAKYYDHTMQTNSLYDKKTIHSGNLYQIMTYVENEHLNTGLPVSGMLLYAKTDESLVPDQTFSIHGKRFWVKTLDLDCDFQNIEGQLKILIDNWSE